MVQIMIEECGGGHLRFLLGLIARIIVIVDNIQECIPLNIHLIYCAMILSKNHCDSFFLG